MQTLTLNIETPELTEKILELLKGFEGQGLELSTDEDLYDLKAIQDTRQEETISFEDYLANEA